MAFFGLQNKTYNGEAIEIQCNIHQGFPSFDITGLADEIIKESKDRIRASIRAEGLRFPQETILVNLSPPSFKKTGTSFDLPIALSILFGKSAITENIISLGELDLNGRILKTPGSESILINACFKRCSIVVVPKDNAISEKDKEYYLNHYKMRILECSCLQEAFDGILDALNELEDGENNLDDLRASTPLFDDKIDTNPLSGDTKLKHPFEGIIGLKTEKEALAVAIAGGHNLLFFGGRGVGKSMLLERCQNLKSKLDEKTEHEREKIYSVFNRFDDNKVRCLYLDTSGKNSVFQERDNPPEILLYHGGSVIIDEITKLDEKTISTLQSVNDTGLLRLKKDLTYPLRFNVLGSFNPCPCGALGSKNSVCYCSENKISAHLKNIASPLISRFDIVTAVKEADFLHDDENGFDDIEERIENARVRMFERYKDDADIRLNGDIAVFNRSAERIRKAYMYFPESESPREALLYYGVALTLADLDDSDEIKPIHREKALLLKVKSPREYFTR